MKQELKIIGINPIWITALLTGTFLVVCATGGENVHWGYLGFELIFPFYLWVCGQLKKYQEIFDRTEVKKP